MFLVSHKTIFILDHSAVFLASCKQAVEYDIFSKMRQGVIPLSPISKTMWTCDVEAAMEYVRIVYDIFARDKLVRFVVSDTKPHSFPETWSQEHQNLDQLMEDFAKIGPPSKTTPQADCDITIGINAALEMLCVCSDAQQRARQATTDTSEMPVNKGRIICISNCKSKAHVKTVEEFVSDTLNKNNQQALAAESLMPLTQLEFVLIHTLPVGDETGVIDKPMREVNPVLNCEVIVSQSGRFLAAKMAHLVQLHYGLSSTTVTGIPMKEEQNANTSANYDVELLHPKMAHDELSKMGCLKGVVSCREGVPYETVTLKWCTPRSNVVDLQYCTGAWRISPMDVNSRPSSCLTNFLVAGRAVMLEQPKKSGQKVLSHMLTSHGGELFIHTLGTFRSPLEDPPSISEGCGGRVTDYRITDFGEFMKENRLAPCSVDQELTVDKNMKPIDKAIAKLERMTRVWPIAISESLIFNLSNVNPLPAQIIKSSLTADEVTECKKVIFHLIGLESRNETLTVPVMGFRAKSGKREEQYKQVWSELETLLRAHAGNSPGHQQVLDCLLECRKPSQDGTSQTSKSHREKKSPAASFVKEEKTSDLTDLEQAWKDVERYQNMTEQEKLDFNKGIQSAPVSPPRHPTKRFRADMLGFKTKGTGPQNLLTMWNNRLEAIYASRHCEFEGRLNSINGKAKLYQHLNLDDEMSPSIKRFQNDQSRRSESPSLFKRTKTSL